MKQTNKQTAVPALRLQVAHGIVGLEGVGLEDMELQLLTVG